jgi:DNA-binding Lrp family transcriptional regulator
MKPGTPAPAAMAAVKAGPPTTPIEKKRRISDKVRRACELLAKGKAKTQTEAAEKVGMARESLTRALARPDVAEYIRTIAVRTIGLAAGRAAEVKAELLDCSDNMVRDRSSTYVLGVAGIAPDTAASINVNVNIKAGYVIDLSDDDRQPMRTISP